MSDENSHAHQAMRAMQAHLDSVGGKLVVPEVLWRYLRTGKAGQHTFPAPKDHEVRTRRAPSWRPKTNYESERVRGTYHYADGSTLEVHRPDPKGKARFTVLAPEARTESVEGDSHAHQAMRAMQQHMATDEFPVHLFWERLARGGNLLGPTGTPKFPVGREVEGMTKRAQARTSGPKSGGRRTRATFEYEDGSRLTVHRPHESRADTIRFEPVASSKTESADQIARTRFNGPAFIKVLQKHGYTRSGERRGIRGEPGEVWHRGGETKPTIDGSSASFGADTVHVIDYQKSTHGLPRYSWSHRRGEDLLARDSTTHGDNAAELDAHLQKRHGSKTESADELISKKLLEGSVSRLDRPRGTKPSGASSGGDDVTMHGLMSDEHEQAVQHLQDLPDRVLMHVPSVVKHLKAKGLHNAAREIGAMDTDQYEDYLVNHVHG